MSVFTLKRLLAVAVAVLATSAVFANDPPPRSLARMAFDKNSGLGILFGGESAVDRGTQLAYSSDETWLWVGSGWVQRFPAHHPDARSGQGMVYDSAAQHVLLFGGRREKQTVDGTITFYNDTWYWSGDDWTRISTADAPSPRTLAGMAYDPVRNRTVLFGGVTLQSAGVLQALYDTWEFDGSNWTQVGTPDALKVTKPLLAWDSFNNQIIMLALKADLTTGMYRYDAQAHTWNEVTTAADHIPPCINEGVMARNDDNGAIIYTGGACVGVSPSSDESWRWDGTQWTKVGNNPPARAFDQAFAYDDLRDRFVMYGGHLTSSSVPQSATLTFRNGAWRGVYGETRPAPRSLAAFVTDTTRGQTWLFGGLNEYSSGYLASLWGYRNAQWYQVSATTNAPVTCDGSLAAFDSDRGVLVVSCGGDFIYEYDGTSWKAPTTTKNPPFRRFAGMVYDASIKKTVLFGGFDSNSNYRNDTWLWNGTDWTEVRNTKATSRGLMTMWYDPLMHKTVIYGGIGRASIDEHVTRYTDMWSFDGSNWTKLSVTDTPGMRLGAQAAIDPHTGKLVLIGGLRTEQISSSAERQFYDNDMWEWDGTAQKWTRLNPASALPAPRENGMLAYDPASDRLVLFGGYAGFYFADVWKWDGSTWTPELQPYGRRRAAAAIEQ